MASAAIQLPTGSDSPLLTPKSQASVQTSEKLHHVQTTLHFIKELPDGSHLAPSYVGKPESYERPSEAVPVTVHDVSGRELDYTLDDSGFQFYYHESKEKEFFDDEKIKREYYPEWSSS